MSEKKNYLIAGAGSGIGLEICKRLLAEGHNVIAIGRSENDFIKEKELTFFEHDFLSDLELPELSYSLDGLIYCPGTINLKPFTSLKDNDILNDFKVNVLGAFKMVHRYYPNLKSSDGASVLLFSSVAASVGMPYHTSVSVSKSGIEGLTRSLAAEFAPAIRVNCIAPSLTDTPLAKMLLNSDSKREANAERHPLKRIGTTEDISSLALYLLKDAKWMTGQVIGINGGLGTIFK